MIGTWATPGQTRMTVLFVILVTHLKSYTETTDRRDFSGKPSKWGWGWVLSWKILEFCSVVGARSKPKKNSHFSGYPSTILSKDSKCEETASSNKSKQ